MEKERSQENRRLTDDEIRQRIADLEALQQQHPDIDALSNDGGLPAEQYRIWQDLKILPVLKAIIGKSDKK
jgi:hypothetical protein